MEPEAVSPEEQERITRDAARAAREREQEVLDGAALRIGVELNRLESAKLSGRTLSHVRAMKRQLVQLAHTLNRDRV